MGSLFGGGGGGSPPTAPKLKQVDTSLTGPLYTQSAAMGDQWANLMRGSYGLGQSTGPASWEAKYLGPGALAMQGQAALPFAGKQDPQVQSTLTTAFGKPSGAGLGGSTWNIGSDPYQVSKELGQQPYQQLQRDQQFENKLLSQWQPPNLRLTGEDLLSVNLQQQAQNAQAQQAAYEAALQGSSYAASAQSQAQGAETAALGKLGAAGINALSSPSLDASGYAQPSLLGGLFGGGIPSGPTAAYSGNLYGAGSDVSSTLGPTLESGTAGMSSGGS